MGCVKLTHLDPFPSPEFNPYLKEKIWHLSFLKQPNLFSMRHSEQLIAILS